MALPIAQAGVGGAVIPYATWAGVTTRALADGISTPGTGGASIAGWQWTLLDAPVGSAASISNSTTSTPTLIGIDLAGDYRIMLVVTDDIGGISEANPFLAPQTAFVIVSATTRYAALKKQAIGERDYIEHGRTLVDEVDSLRGNLAPYKTAWVSPTAGDATANGTPGNPYNTTSAVAEGYTSPIEQALAVLDAIVPANASEEMAPLTIHLMPGTYAAINLSIQTACPVKFIHHGHVVVGTGSLTADECTWTRQLIAKTYSWLATTRQTFWVEPDVADGGIFMLTGSIVLSDGSGGIHNNLVMRNAYFVNISLSGQTGVCSVQLDDCNMRTTGSIVIAVASSYVKARNSTFLGPITLASGYVDAERCSFYDDVTVGQTTGKFLACDFGTPGFNFSGPSGSARFDAHSLQTFRALAWTFVGNASERDVIMDSALYEIAGGAASSLSNKVTATQFTNTSDSFLLQEDDAFIIRPTFDVVVAPGDEAELSLYMCDSATIVATGVKITSVSVDATCRVHAEIYVRCDNVSASVVFDAKWFKKGATVPATLVPDNDLVLFPSTADVRFAWVLTPAGAGTWTAGSTATFERAKIHRLLGKYI